MGRKSAGEGIGYPSVLLGFLVGPAGKESAYNVRRSGFNPGEGNSLKTTEIYFLRSGD